jgi:precorrin-6B methylase 2
MVRRNLFEYPVTFLLRKIDLLSCYSLRRIGPLKEDGWFRSFREEACVDAEGDPVPWMTYPAVEFLRKRIRKNMSVFEYGCGTSTLWWASRVREVISVEHDKDWYEKIARKVPGNVCLSHIELDYGGSYSRYIREYKERFDIVVIDGRDRVHCAIHAADALNSTGIIIWDNSDRVEYEAGSRFLFDKGFRKIEFVGLAPVLNMKTETGIYYRSDNCLGI